MIIMKVEVWHMRKILEIIILAVTLILCIYPAMADDIIVAFEKKEYSVLAGKSETIRPVIQGTKAKGKYSYSSSDTSIATVNNGQIKGISVGDTTISCTVKIGENEYNCSYVLHVGQPVTNIEVSEKEYTVPQEAVFRESPFKILPENATNKDVEYTSSNRNIAVVDPSGIIRIGRSSGTATITCKALDGSGVKASVKVTIPRGAWFSIDKNATITEPEGITFFFTHVFTASFNQGTTYCTNNVIEERYGSYDNEEALEEYLSSQPFYFPHYSLIHVSQMTLIPKKTGTGKFVVNSNGVTAAINVKVERSAVYQELKYEMYQKNETNNNGMRFSVQGSVYKIEGRDFYISYNGDETKQIIASLPESSPMSELQPGHNVIMNGVFLGMTAYKTETGLTKSIPAFTIEKIYLQ